LSKNIDFLIIICYTISVIQGRGVLRHGSAAINRRFANSERRIFKMKVTKDTLIGDILDFDVETARFFFEIGMHCLGCPHSRGESIEDACLVHGTNADELVAKINDYLASK